jgi:hypothetical protein
MIQRQLFNAIFMPHLTKRPLLRVLKYVVRGFFLWTTGLLLPVFLYLRAYGAQGLDPGMHGPVKTRDEKRVFLLPVDQHNWRLLFRDPYERCL